MVHPTPEHKAFLLLLNIKATKKEQVNKIKKEGLGKRGGKEEEKR